jgi:hypothetical protein
MKTSTQKAVSQSQKMAQQGIQVLKADPEFKRLRLLVPRKLRKRNCGQDYTAITTDTEFARDRAEVILLSAQDWTKYEELQKGCKILADRYDLREWVVFDLAVGVKPSPVPAKTIRGYLAPFIILPKNFEPNKQYIFHTLMIPKPEATEIMKRLPDNMDHNTVEEIKAYLTMLMRTIPECQIAELGEQDPSTKVPRTAPEIAVHITIPPGYSAREVSKVYGQLDKQRRVIMKALGMPLLQRRRTSKILKDADKLELFRVKPCCYDIIDKKYGENLQPEKEQRLRKEIKNKRYAGRKMLYRRGIPVNRQATI